MSISQWLTESHLTGVKPIASLLSPVQVQVLRYDAAVQGLVAGGLKIDLYKAKTRFPMNYTYCPLFSMDVKMHLLYLENAWKSVLWNFENILKLCMTMHTDADQRPLALQQA